MWKSYEYFVGLLILSTADMLSGAMLKRNSAHLYCCT